jgi:hypothetical protein
VRIWPQPVCDGNTHWAECVTAIAAGMTLDDVQTDLVAKVQEHLSFKKWLTQEVPWYQSYMKSGLTMYLLYYMLQVRKQPI